MATRPLQQPLVPDPDWKKWIGNWEEWVIRREVLEMAEDKESKGEKVTHFSFAGPALKEVIPATFVLWIFAALVPFIAGYTSSCPNENTPFAHYSSWMYLLFLPVVSISFWCEFRALRYELCTYLMYCAPFRFFGRKLSFLTWIIFVGLIGMASHADILTNGLLISKIITTLRCAQPKAEKIGLMWHYVIKASCLQWTPWDLGVRIVGRLDVLVIMCFLCMLLQPLFCFLHVRPLPSNRPISYEKDSMQDGYETCWSRFFRLNPDRRGRYVLHHADNLQVVAFVNRMISIVDKNLTWSLERSRELIAGKRDDKFSRAFSTMAREFARLKNRIWLVNVFEKGFMLEVQVSIFAISRSLMPPERAFWGRVDGQMLLSIALSFLCYIKALYDVWDQDKVIHRFVNEVNANEEFQGFLQTFGDDKQQSVRHGVKRYQKGIFRTMIYFRTGGVFMVLILGHCTLKLLMAFVCEDSLWDLTLWSRKKKGLEWDGCVDLSHVLDQ